MKEIKFKKLDLKNKKMWIGLSVIVVAVVGVIFYITGRTHSTGSDDVLGNKLVDGLSFENATLNYVEGVSTYNVEVYNESGDTYNLKTIDIKITKENDEEVTLVGYIGDSLDVDEGRVLKASIDQDVSDAKKVEYIINK